ncbi:MAG: ANTAR domain-containing protein [Lachnospiraceae bacterium]|nr:ANTAR domain-containing protein [Lachnospiraceae bacterium]
MVFDERSYSVLIVSASAKFNELIASVLPEGMYSPVVYAESVTIAKRALIDRTYDMIVVNSPLPDEEGTNFAIDACRHGNSVCLLIAKDEFFDEMYNKVVRQGVFVLSKPLNSMILSRSIKWLEAARERLRAMETKASSVEEKMEEIRLVNKAKWLLIDKKGMTEADAHRFIEKQAMDNSATKRSVADKVIKLLQK